MSVLSNLLLQTKVNILESAGNFVENMIAVGLDSYAGWRRQFNVSIQSTQQLCYSQCFSQRHAAYTNISWRKMAPQLILKLPELFFLPTEKVSSI